MEETFISWNVTNWITIVVMAFLGFLLVGMGAQAYRQFQARKSAA